MSFVNAKCENNVLTLALCGRVDSTNAPAVESELEEARAAAHASLVLDLEKLEYISSAGLRVILRLRKNEPTLSAINASPEVYEIFDMTGFSEMIPVSKAYRRLSVDGCEVIGRGANGMVYRIDADTIVKVYYSSDALPDIHRERELARRAFVLGIPTAIPYDVVKVGESYGSVFELLNAKSFAKLVDENPADFQHYVDLSVELLKKIHATEVQPEDMPDMRDVAIDWVRFLEPYLPAETWEKLLSMVEAVPVQHNMLHGDYHVKNVMLQNGEVLLIDMDTLCQGHPIFELASVFNAYIGYRTVDPVGAANFLGMPADVTELFWTKTLEGYLGSSDSAVTTPVEKKAMLIGYARMMRRYIRRHALESDEGRAMIALCKDTIIRLTDEVDSLVF